MTWPETVHPVEAAWAISAFVTVVFAGRAARKWSRIERALTADEDRGACLLAGMVATVCWTLLAMATLEIVAAVPPLLLAPRPDAPTSDLARLGPLVTQSAFLAFNVVISWLAWWIGHRTSHIARPSGPYTGPDRRRSGA